jgi:hypothetical protein
MIKVHSFPAYIESEHAPKELPRAGDVPMLIVEWGRAEGLLWTLGLCEYYGVQNARWEYPTPVRWDKVSEGHLAYVDHPVTKDRSIAGRTSVAVGAKGDELSFEVTLHNDSPTTWQDAWGWVCLIHRWAGPFQANCELPVEGPADDPWVSCASLRAPKGRWLKWCPVARDKQIAERIGRNQAHMWQPHIEATRGAVRAWRMDLRRPIQQFVELSSDNAIILGWSHWPCTDMGLYFGSLDPGSYRTAYGKLRFFEEPYEPF